MKRFFLKVLGLFFLLLPLCLQGGPVTVTGRVNRAEALVRLLVIDDLLTMHETEVARTTSDAQGFFLLEGAVDQVTPACLAVELERVDWVVTPGASYEVTVTLPEVDPSKSYFERPLPTLRIKTASDNGLCRQLIVSDQITNSYVLDYFDALYLRRQYRYLDSIKAALQANLGEGVPYVRQYNDYRIASVQMAVNADGGKKVINEYFDGKPVLYRCQSYMDLFKDLFKNNTLEDGFLQRNPRLAELIKLYRLRNYYNEEPRARKAVREQLQRLRAKTQFAETRQGVDHVLAEFDRFATGASAPDFALKDVTGATVKLSDFKDQMVVLQFVEGGSATVEHQFETLADLHRQWQDSVQLVTVCTKDQMAACRKRFEEHRYDWPLLNLGNDLLLLERYEVRTFPEYFIILPGTKIGMAPAPSPDQTLDKHVTHLYGK
ncbi:MAG: redoxin domain-containing protein [Bacteroidales bacterium]|nr:redoxin domain-containing protein [Bacteroidales bacterium]